MRGEWKKIKKCIPDVPEENKFDSIMVGSGGAATFAALEAHKRGASVLVLESENIIGGTTSTSGAHLWIPNNYLAKEKYQSGTYPFPTYLPRRDLVLKGETPGVDFIQSTTADCDPKIYAMRYICRLVHPEYYDKTRAFNGLNVNDYKLIERYYDDGNRIMEETRDQHGNSADPDNYLFGWSLNVSNLSPGTPYGDQFGAGEYLQPDNFDTEEGTFPGRHVEWTDLDTNTKIEGYTLINRVMEYITTNGINQVKTGKRVIDLVADNILAVQDVNTGEMEYYQARNGIVFANGGYIRNASLSKDLLRGRILASCSGPGSKGDFVNIAMKNGMKMQNMQVAWLHEMDYEKLTLPLWFLWHNSCIVLNKYGHRVYNEGAKYNERGRVHFHWDPNKGEYPNYLLVLIYDGQTMHQDVVTGYYPTLHGNIHGETLSELYDELEKHLPFDYLTDKTVWVDKATESIDKYNTYCENGVDPEFHREQSLSTKHNMMTGKLAAGISYDPNLGMRSVNPGVAPTNPSEYAYPDFAMQPLQPNQPEGGTFPSGYYALILAPTAIDSHGGPQLNYNCMVPRTKGIYAAGNAGAGVFNAAYPSTGATIGWCMISGTIAGKAAALNEMDNQNDLYGDVLHITSPTPGSVVKNPVKIYYSFDGEEACPKVNNRQINRVFYKLDGDLNEYVREHQKVLASDGWIEVECDDRFEGIKVCFDQTGWHNVCIQLAKRNGRSLGAQFANMVDFRVEENYLVKVGSYTRTAMGSTMPYHFELAQIPNTRLASMDIRTTDILRFYFADSAHNLVHNTTNDLPPSTVLFDTTDDPDLIPSTNSNRKGFAFDWRPPYTTENVLDQYSLWCTNHAGEQDRELIVNVTSVTDNCLQDLPDNIDHIIYVGSFFFSGEGNPATDPSVPNLNVIKGTQFVKEGQIVRYKFNENNHTAKHVAYNNLVDPGTNLSTPAFNFVPSNNGDFFDWTAVRNGSDEITQMFVVCQPHRTIFGQGHRGELIVLPSGSKPYDHLIAIGSVPYSLSSGSYVPDYNGTKYPYFQLVDSGSFTQKLPATGSFPATTLSVNVGQTVRWIFIEQGHNVVEVNSDGSPHSSPAFQSITSDNSVYQYDWTPTSADIGDHYYTCNLSLGAGYSTHVVHTLSVSA